LKGLKIDVCEAAGPLQAHSRIANSHIRQCANPL
jgi:hypothetical protein